MNVPTPTFALDEDELERAIWNPVVAAGWSLLFTPAFGAYIAMRNWQTLGRPRQAANARHWFTMSLLLLGVQLLGAAINARLNSQSDLLRWVELAFLLSWFGAVALPQAIAMRAGLGAGRPRRGWEGALLAAVLAAIAYLAARTVLTALLGVLT